MNEEEKKEWKKGKLMSEGLNRKAQLIQIKHTLWANHSQLDLDKDSSSQSVCYFIFFQHSLLPKEKTK